MKPIPEAAMPVVEILRRDVERPRELPERVPGFGLGFREQKHGRQIRCCPLGLHPKITIHFPSNYIAHRRLGIPFKTVQAFTDQWWDGLSVEDAQEAVDAIWPPEK